MATCAVRENNSIKAFEETDKPGTQILGADRSAYDLYLTRALAHAELVRAADPGALFMVVWNGITNFWPKPVAVVEIVEGTVIAGEPTRNERFRPGQAILNARAACAGRGGWWLCHPHTLYKIANFDLYGDEFRWAPDAVTPLSPPSEGRARPLRGTGR